MSLLSHPLEYGDLSPPSIESMTTTLFSLFIIHSRSYLHDGLSASFIPKSPQKGTPEKRVDLELVVRYLNREIVPAWILRLMMLYARTNLDVILHFLIRWRNRARSSFDAISKNKPAEDVATFLRNLDPALFEACLDTTSAQDGDADKQKSIAEQSLLAHKSKVFDFLVDVVFCRVLLEIIAPLVDTAYDSALAITQNSAAATHDKSGSQTTRDYLISSISNPESLQDGLFTSSSSSSSSQRRNSRRSYLGLPSSSSSTPSLFRTTLEHTSRLRDVHNEATAYEIPVKLRAYQHDLHDIELMCQNFILQAPLRVDKGLFSLFNRTTDYNCQYILHILYVSLYQLWPHVVGVVSSAVGLINTDPTSIRPDYSSDSPQQYSSSSTMHGNAGASSALGIMNSYLYQFGAGGDMMSPYSQASGGVGNGYDAMMLGSGVQEANPYASLSHSPHEYGANMYHTGAPNNDSSMYFNQQLLATTTPESQAYYSHQQQLLSQATHLQALSNPQVYAQLHQAMLARAQQSHPTPQQLQACGPLSHDPVIDQLAMLPQPQLSFGFLLFRLFDGDLARDAHLLHFLEKLDAKAKREAGKQDKKKKKKDDHQDDQQGSNSDNDTALAFRNNAGIRDAIYLDPLTLKREDMERICAVLSSFTLDLSCNHNLTTAISAMTAITTLFTTKHKPFKPSALKRWLCYTIYNILWPLADRPLVQGLDYSQWHATLSTLYNEIMEWAITKQKDWLIALPPLTAILCVSAKQNFLMNFGSLQPVLRSAYAHPIACVTALRCAQRIIYTHLTRISDGDLHDGTVNVVTLLAGDILRAAHKHSLSVMIIKDRTNNTTTNTSRHIGAYSSVPTYQDWDLAYQKSTHGKVSEDSLALDTQDVTRAATISMLLPPFSQWLSGDLESEDAYLAIVITVACWNPAYAIDHLVVPLISKEYAEALQLVPASSSTTATIAKNDPVFVAASGMLQTTEKAVPKSKYAVSLSQSQLIDAITSVYQKIQYKMQKPRLTLLGDTIYDSNIVLGLRALSLIFMGKFSLSPLLKTSSGIYLDPHRDVTSLIHHILSYYSQRYRPSGGSTSNVSYGGLALGDATFHSHLVTNKDSLESNIDAATGKTSVTESILKNHSFAWASTQSVIAELLPMLPQLHPIQTYAIISSPLGHVLSTAISSIFTSAYPLVADQTYLAYDPAVTPLLLQSKRGVIQAYQLVLMACSFIWPKTLVPAQLFDALVKAVIHCDRSIRMAAAKVLGAFVSDPSKSQFRAPVINTLAQCLLDLPVTCRHPIPQFYLASSESVLTTLGDGTNGVMTGISQAINTHQQRMGVAGILSVQQTGKLSNHDANTPTVADNKLNFTHNQMAYVAQLLSKNVMCRVLHFPSPHHTSSQSYLTTHTTKIDPLLLPLEAHVNFNPQQREHTRLQENHYINLVANNNTRNQRALRRSILQAQAMQQQGSHVKDSSGRSLPLPKLSDVNTTTVYHATLTSQLNPFDAALTDLCIDVVKGTAPSEYGSEAAVALLAQLRRLLLVVKEGAYTTLQETKHMTHQQYRVDLHSQVVQKHQKSLANIERAKEELKLKQTIHDRELSMRRGLDNAYGLNSLEHNHNAFYSHIQHQQQLYSRYNTPGGAGLSASDGDEPEMGSTASDPLNAITVTLPTPQEIILETDIIYLHHLAQSETSLSVLLSSLGAFSWSDIEASLVSTLLSPSSGVRALTLDTMNTFHQLSTIHLELVDCLKSIEVLRQELYIRIGFHDEVYKDDEGAQATAKGKSATSSHTAKSTSALKHHRISGIGLNHVSNQRMSGIHQMSHHQHQQHQYSIDIRHTTSNALAMDTAQHIVETGQQISPDTISGVYQSQIPRSVSFKAEPGDDSNGFASMDSPAGDHTTSSHAQTPFSASEQPPTMMYHPPKQHFLYYACVVADHLAKKKRLDIINLPSSQRYTLGTDADEDIPLSNSCVGLSSNGYEHLFRAAINHQDKGQTDWASLLAVVLQYSLKEQLSKQLILQIQLYQHRFCSTGSEYSMNGGGVENGSQIASTLTSRPPLVIYDPTCLPSFFTKTSLPQQQQQQQVGSPLPSPSADSLLTQPQPQAQQNHGQRIAYQGRSYFFQTVPPLSPLARLSPVLSVKYHALTNPQNKDSKDPLLQQTHQLLQGDQHELTELLQTLNPTSLNNHLFSDITQLFKVRHKQQVKDAKGDNSALNELMNNLKSQQESENDVVDQGSTDVFTSSDFNSNHDERKLQLSRANTTVGSIAASLLYHLRNIATFATSTCILHSDQLSISTQTTIDTLTVLSNYLDGRREQLAQFVSTTDGKEDTAAHQHVTKFSNSRFSLCQKVLNIILSQSIGPWLFVDHVYMIQPLVSLLLSPSSTLSHIAAFAYGHTTVYAQHLVQHALALVEMATYQSDASDLLGHLPAFAENICASTAQGDCYQELYQSKLSKCHGKHPAMKYRRIAHVQMGIACNVIPYNYSLDTWESQVINEIIDMETNEKKQSSALSTGDAPAVDYELLSTPSMAHHLIPFGTSDLDLDSLFTRISPSQQASGHSLPATTSTGFYSRIAPSYRIAIPSAMTHHQSGMNLHLLADTIDDANLHRTDRLSTRKRLTLRRHLLLYYTYLTQYAEPNLFATSHHLRLRAFISLNDNIQHLCRHMNTTLHLETITIKSIVSQFIQALALQSALVDDSLFAAHTNRTNLLADVDDHEGLGINHVLGNSPYIYSLSPYHRRMLFKFLTQYTGLKAANVSGNYEKLHNASTYLLYINYVAEGHLDIQDRLSSHHDVLSLVNNTVTNRAKRAHDAKLLKSKKAKALLKSNNLDPTSYTQEYMSQIDAQITPQLDLDLRNDNTFLHQIVDILYRNNINTLASSLYVTQNPDIRDIIAEHEEKAKQRSFVSQLFRLSKSDTSDEDEKERNQLPTHSFESLCLTLYSQSIDKLNSDSVSAMSFLLAGPNFDSNLSHQLKILRIQPIHEYKGLIYPWLFSLLTSDITFLRDCAMSSLHLLLNSNPTLCYAFMHHCYHSSSRIATPLFLVLSRVMLLSYNASLTHSAVQTPTLECYTASSENGGDDNSPVTSLSMCHCGCGNLVHRPTRIFTHPNQLCQLLDRASSSTSPDSTIHSNEHSDKVSVKSPALRVPQGLAPIHLLLHLLVYKLGDPSYSIRAAALRLLPVIEVHCESQMFYKQNVQLQEKINALNGKRAPLDAYNDPTAVNQSIRAIPLHTNPAVQGKGALYGATSGNNLHRRFILPADFNQMDDLTLTADAVFTAEDVAGQAGQYQMGPHSVFVEKLRRVLQNVPSSYLMVPDYFVLRYYNMFGQLPSGDSSSSSGDVFGQYGTPLQPRSESGCASTRCQGAYTTHLILSSQGQNASRANVRPTGALIHTKKDIPIEALSSTSYRYQHHNPALYEDTPVSSDPYSHPHNPLSYTNAFLSSSVGSVTSTSITSTVPDSYRHIQRSWSHRLATQFKPLSIDFLHEALVRISAVGNGCDDFHTSRKLNTSTQPQTPQDILQLGQTSDPRTLLAALSGVASQQREMLQYLPPWLNGVVFSSITYPLWVPSYPALDPSVHLCAVPPSMLSSPGQPSSSAQQISYPQVAEELPYYHPLYLFSGSGPHDLDIGVSSGCYYGIYPVSTAVSHRIRPVNAPASAATFSDYQENNTIVLGHTQTQALLWALFDTFAMMMIVLHAERVIKKAFAKGNKNTERVREIKEWVVDIFRSKQDKRNGKYLRKAQKLGLLGGSDDLQTDGTTFAINEFEAIFRSLLQWPTREGISLHSQTDSAQVSHAHSFATTTDLRQFLLRQNVSVVLSFMVHGIPAHFNDTIPSHVINATKSIALYCMRADGFTTMRFLANQLTPSSMQFAGRIKPSQLAQLITRCTTFEDSDTIRDYMTAHAMLSVDGLCTSGTYQGVWMSHIYTCQTCYHTYIQNFKELFRPALDSEQQYVFDTTPQYYLPSNHQHDQLHSGLCREGQQIINSFTADSSGLPMEMDVDDHFSARLASINEDNALHPSSIHQSSLPQTTYEEEQQTTETVIGEDGDEEVITTTTTTKIIIVTNVVKKKQSKKDKQVDTTPAVADEPTPTATPEALPQPIHNNDGDDRSIALPIEVALPISIPLPHPVTTLSLYGPGEKTTLSFLSQQSHLICQWIYPQLDVIPNAQATLQQVVPGGVLGVVNIVLHHFIDSASLALLFLTDCVYELTLPSQLITDEDQPTCDVTGGCLNQTNVANRCFYCHSYSFQHPLNASNHQSLSKVVLSSSCQVFGCVCPWSLLVEVAHLGVMGLGAFNSLFTRSHSAGLLVNLTHAMTLLHITDHGRITTNGDTNQLTHTPVENAPVVVSELATSMINEHYENYASNSPLSRLVYILTAVISNNIGLRTCECAVAEAWKLLAVLWSKTTTQTPSVMYALHVFTQLRSRANLFSHQVLCLLVQSSVKQVKKWLPVVAEDGFSSLGSPSSPQTVEKYTSYGEVYYGKTSCAHSSSHVDILPSGEAIDGTCELCMDCIHRNTWELAINRYRLPHLLHFVPSFDDVHPSSSISSALDSEDDITSQSFSGTQSYNIIELSIAYLLKYAGSFVRTHQAMHMAYVRTQQCYFDDTGGDTTTSSPRDGQYDQESLCTLGSSCKCGIDTHLNMISHHLRAITHCLGTLPSRVVFLVHQLISVSSELGISPPTTTEHWTKLFTQYSPPALSQGARISSQESGSRPPEPSSRSTTRRPGTRPATGRALPPERAQRPAQTVSRNRGEQQASQAKATSSSTKDPSKAKAQALGILTHDLVALSSDLRLVTFLYIALLRLDSQHIQPTSQDIEYTTISTYTPVVVGLRIPVLAALYSFLRLPIFSPRFQEDGSVSNYPWINDSLIATSNEFYVSNTGAISPLSSPPDISKENLYKRAISSYAVFTQWLACSRPYYLLPTTPLSLATPFMGLTHELQRALATFDPSLKLLSLLVLSTIWSSCHAVLSLSDTHTMFPLDVTSTSFLNVYQLPILSDFTRFSRQYERWKQMLPINLTTSSALSTILQAIPFISQILNRPDRCIHLVSYGHITQAAGCHDIPVLLAHEHDHLSNQTLIYGTDPTQSTTFVTVSPEHQIGSALHPHPTGEPSISHHLLCPHTKQSLYLCQDTPFYTSYLPSAHHVLHSHWVDTLLHDPVCSFVPASVPHMINQSSPTKGTIQVNFRILLVMVSRLQLVALRLSAVHVSQLFLSIFTQLKLQLSEYFSLTAQASDITEPHSSFPSTLSTHSAIGSSNALNSEVHFVRSNQVLHAGPLNAALYTSTGTTPQPYHQTNRNSFQTVIPGSDLIQPHSIGNPIYSLEALTAERQAYTLLEAKLTRSARNGIDVSQFHPFMLSSAEESDLILNIIANSSLASSPIQQKSLQSILLPQHILPPYLDSTLLLSIDKFLPFKSTADLASSSFLLPLVPTALTVSTANYTSDSGLILGRLGVAVAEHMAFVHHVINPLSLCACGGNYQLSSPHRHGDPTIPNAASGQSSHQTITNQVSSQSHSYLSDLSSESRYNVFTHNFYLLLQGISPIHHRSEMPTKERKSTPSAVGGLSHSLQSTLPKVSIASVITHHVASLVASQINVPFEQLYNDDWKHMSYLYTHLQRSNRYSEHNRRDDRFNEVVHLGNQHHSYSMPDSTQSYLPISAQSALSQHTSRVQELSVSHASHHHHHHQAFSSHNQSPHHSQESVSRSDLPSQTRTISTLYSANGRKKRSDLVSVRLEVFKQSLTHALYSYHLEGCSTQIQFLTQILSRMPLCQCAQPNLSWWPAIYQLSNNYLSSSISGVASGLVQTILRVVGPQRGSALLAAVSSNGNLDLTQSQKNIFTYNNAHHESYNVSKIIPTPGMGAVANLTVLAAWAGQRPRLPTSTLDLFTNIYHRHSPDGREHFTWTMNRTHHTSLDKVMSYQDALQQQQQQEQLSRSHQLASSLTATSGKDSLRRLETQVDTQRFIAEKMEAQSANRKHAIQQQREQQRFMTGLLAGIGADDTSNPSVKQSAVVEQQKRRQSIQHTLRAIEYTFSKYAPIQFLAGQIPSSIRRISGVPTTPFISLGGGPSATASRQRAIATAVQNMIDIVTQSLRKTSSPIGEPQAPSLCDIIDTIESPGGSDPASDCPAMDTLETSTVDDVSPDESIQADDITHVDLPPYSHSESRSSFESTTPPQPSDSGLAQVDSSSTVDNEPEPSHDTDHFPSSLMHPSTSFIDEPDISTLYTSIIEDNYKMCPEPMQISLDTLEDEDSSDANINTPAEHLPQIAEPSEQPSTHLPLSSPVRRSRESRPSSVPHTTPSQSTPRSFDRQQSNGYSLLRAPPRSMTPRPPVQPTETPSAATPSSTHRPSGSRLSLRNQQAQRTPSSAHRHAGIGSTPSRISRSGVSSSSNSRSTITSTPKQQPHQQQQQQYPSHSRPSSAHSSSGITNRDQASRTPLSTPIATRSTPASTSQKPTHSQVLSQRLQAKRENYLIKTSNPNVPPEHEQQQPVRGSSHPSTNISNPPSRTRVNGVHMDPAHPTAAVNQEMASILRKRNQDQDRQ